MNHTPIFLVRVLDGEPVEAIGPYMDPNAYSQDGTTHLSLANKSHATFDLQRGVIFLQEREGDVFRVKTTTTEHAFTKVRATLRLSSRGSKTVAPTA